MSITDKTRKILWARSGNRCAMCRKVLVEDESALDPEAIIADECHIVSGLPKGPRYDPSFPIDEIDHVSNLMLLCAVHHRLVDSQKETYTSDLLRQFKRNHEAWVEVKLKDDPSIAKSGIRRFKENIPKQLQLVQSGRQLFGEGPTFHGCYQRTPERMSEEETGLVGDFLGNIEDLMGVFDELDARCRLECIREMDRQLESLKEHGLLVFSGIERQRMEGGAGPSSDWIMLHLAVTRLDELITGLEESIKAKSGDGSTEEDPSHSPQS